MASCAAFGCNNRGTKGNGLSFFSFPKDGQLRKAWIHYCRRWNFDPTSGHRLCSIHFTRDCFERDPLRMMELGTLSNFHVTDMWKVVRFIRLMHTRLFAGSREWPSSYDWNNWSFAIFFSPGQVMLGAHLGLHLASVVAWRFHQLQVPSFSRDPFKSSHRWSGWSTIGDLMLDRNSIVHSNGSRLFSAGRPLGTRKNSSPLPLVPLVLHPNAAQDTIWNF
jgi:hypothetical protein